MKKMHILLMSFAIIPLLIWGCGKATNPVDVPLSEDSGVSSLAKGSPFDMNDRFATETGASGDGEIEVDDGEVEIEVEAEGLLPNHPYELIVTIGPQQGGTPEPTSVRKFQGQSDGEGEIEFEEDLDLVGIEGPGDYRLDFFVTHDHATVSGSPGGGVALTALLDRDPLLACAPAQFVTVSEEEEDEEEEEEEEGPFTATVDISTVTNPGQTTVSNGVLQVRGQQRTGPITGGLVGTITLVADFDIVLANGTGPGSGTFTFQVTQFNNQTFNVTFQGEFEGQFVGFGFPQGFVFSGDLEGESNNESEIEATFTNAANPGVQVYTLSGSIDD